MENTKKALKIVSIAILVLAALSLVSGIIHLATIDESKLKVTKEISLELAKTIAVISGIISLLFILPRVYLGVVGLRGAKEGSRAHIIVAIIFFIFSLIGVIGSISGLFGAADMLNAILGLIESVAVSGLYFIYIKCAREIAKA